MNESISMLKLTIIAALGVIAAYFNVLMIPIVVLVFVMVTDYISGMASAKKSGELTRTAGTVTEQAFDVVNIDRSGRKITMKRIGAGGDREFVFPWAAQNEHNTYAADDVVSYRGRKFRCISPIDENTALNGSRPIESNAVNTTYWAEITE